MIGLTGTSDLVQVITGSALNIDVHASWVDLSAAGGVTPGRTNTLITTATTTTIIGSPAASTQRTVKTITIRNRDAAASDAVTVVHTDGANAPQLIKLTLLAGYTLTYNEGDGWTLIDASGAKVVTPLAGRLLKTTVVTTGTTITLGPATNNVRVRGVGGGGGGAGCTSVAAAASAGGGGGAGGFFDKLSPTTPNATLTYAIGGAGAGNSGAAGGNGGDTTITVNAVLLTAKGGTGAPVATAVGTLTAYAGGVGGIVGTNGDINAPGQAGAPGVTLIVATPIVSSGCGGSGPYGEGGVGIAAVGNGVAGTGNGSGGGGAATGASAVRTGGAGTVGLIQIDEYS